jgi:hypothetical protein
MSSEPLLDGRHNANYGGLPEENLKVLKLKAEIKHMSLWFNIIILLFCIVSAISIYKTIQVMTTLFNTDILIKKGVDVKFPVLFLDEPVTREKLLKPIVAQSVFGPKA